MAGTGLGDPASVVIDLPRTGVTSGKGVPVLAPQGIQENGIGLDEAYECVELAAGDVHCRDHFLHACVAERLPVEPHDLEGAPGGRLQRRILIERTGRLDLGAGAGPRAGRQARRPPGTTDCRVAGIEAIAGQLAEPVRLKPHRRPEHAGNVPVGRPTRLHLSHRLDGSNGNTETRRCRLVVVFVSAGEKIPH